MAKGLFDYSSEEEVDSFSEKENKHGSKALLSSIKKTDTKTDFNKPSENSFSQRNRLSTALDSDDDDSVIKNYGVKNFGKVDSLRCKLSNINNIRENFSKKTEVTPLFSFEKRKDIGLFCEFSTDEGDESSDNSDLENYNKDKNNRRWYFKEQESNFNYMKSSPDIKKDIKLQHLFTTVSLRETYVKACRVMESVFADLDHRTDNILKAKETDLRLSNSAKPETPKTRLETTDIIEQRDPAIRKQESRNLTNGSFAKANAKVKESNRLTVIPKESGRYCHKNHFVPYGQSRCQELCDKLKDCRKHQCEFPCETPHYSHKCNQEIVTKLLCGHEINASCGQTVTTQRCRVKIKTTFKCGHIGVGSCGEASLINCGGRIETKLKCGHFTMYICNGGKIDCQEQCPKKLDCGHDCPNCCSEPCIASAQCPVCINLDEERRKSRNKTYRDLAILKMNEVKKEARKFKIIDLDPSSSTFLDVRDKVLKYVQPIHGWYPEVQSIKEVFNSSLLEVFHSCQASLIEPSTIREKFHGTDAEAVNEIIRNGFRLPINDNQIRMFGRGIYFATDSSKSAQAIYTKGSNVLLLCDVLFGKEMKVFSPQYNMNLETIKNLGYDSIFAPRNTKSEGGVLFDEFVIYDPCQAYPRYVINYKACQLSTSGSTVATKFQKYEIPPNRLFDPSDELDYHFRVADSQFRRFCKTREVVKVTYVVNPLLESEFVETLKKFREKYGNEAEEAKPILAFHGTPIESNIDSILQNNFQKSYIKQTSYGYGHYFSEFPDISLGYAGAVKALILCQLLPGKSQDVNSCTNIAPGFDSNRMGKDSMGRGKMIIIVNEKQILPRYVIHLN
ncbi:uncharacterized protein LOC136028328 [Artemia franciscana]|uniref:Poly [ADP-ribose] polymerase n=1 Tax=Artemia franciscana TaxID=6661 RepID=A0AA88HPI8_ARTSF|nr:hypothetical protein QYM36_014193 [Artemia franciscana]KAK2708499.1 hypothetical protein QYM36_014193 [Artemia franciscana]KAK2708500.1 hypothetical protein QYM36_014193 [Artemia franciscana]KAK2708501.1 hypothetical protein QYM36_014193 [Artemia franciscana]KAK2708502.1 hypothetical protein QYM36_014193 [Artemia franciscana]